MAVLLILTVALIGGCHSGSAWLQFANNANAKERLTLKTTVNTKTRLISTFHGISTGSYTVDNDEGIVAQGTFTRDEKGFEFKASDGTSLFTKLNDDGTFEYLSRTWKPATDYVLREELKGLKAKADIKAAAASTDSTSR